MRKNLLSFALALVMCLGLAVSTMAEGPEVLEENDYSSFWISGYVSKGTAGVKYHSGAPQAYTYDEYTVNPGTVFTVSKCYLAFEPCEYVDGVYVRDPSYDGDFVAVGYEAVDSFTVTAEHVGYWYVYATSLELEKIILVHVTGESAQPAPTTPATSSTPSFTDVAADAYYAAPVTWAVEKGITNGTGNNQFSPGQNCTNAQILTFLWRAYGQPEPTIGNPFTNSIPDAYTKAAVWAYEKGMVSDTVFDADKPCTRAMAVTYMWQAAGSPMPFASADSFTDVPADASYALAVAWALEKGITTGTSATTFSPDEICNRGQIVTFLHRNLA